jgi:hypothetical protein
MKHRSHLLRLSRWGLRVALAAAGSVLALGACIIEERKYDQQLADCTTYCDVVESKCRDNNKVYDRDGACMAVCMRWELGDDFGGVDRNTVACRLEKVLQGDFEAATDCSSVGPGGNGVCGTNCEALCRLRQQVCGPIARQDQLDDVKNYDICMHNCEALPDLGNMNASRDREGDSVQCRLIHIAESAISRGLALEHCEHTQTIPVPGESVPCSDPMTLSKAEDCKKYCTIAMGACTNDVKVFQSQAQCEQQCMLLDPGELGDQNGDGIRCRRYHSYAALGNPIEHCTHAGPTGDGHCGPGNCHSYCRIARSACPTQFAIEYGPASDILAGNDCETACSILEGQASNGFRDTTQRYTVSAPPTGNTVMCRTYHAVEALGAVDDPGHCAAVFGGAECR